MATMMGMDTFGVGAGGAEQTGTGGTTGTGSGIGDSGTDGTVELSILIYVPHGIDYLSEVGNAVGQILFCFSYF